MGVPSRSFKPARGPTWQDGLLRRFGDSLAAEEPLAICAGGTAISVTMRTPGHDDELAAGFLFTEGLNKSPDEIAALHLAGTAGSSRGYETAVIQLSGEKGRTSVSRPSAFSLLSREIRMPNPDFKLNAQLLCSFPEKLRTAQSVFGRTGALHAAALFDKTGTLVSIREDVRALNAVDKVVGWALFSGRSLSDTMIMVSGHGECEIVYKALVAGLPVVASASAPSSLAVQLSRDFGLTLVGFLGSRFVVYAGGQRLGMAQ